MGKKLGKAHREHQSFLHYIMAFFGTAAFLSESEFVAISKTTSPDGGAFHENFRILFWCVRVCVCVCLCVSACVCVFKCE